MARLAPKERAELPPSQFAYVDAQGRRRLPLHDAAHVRNALARFGQVAFEDERAKDQARTRLLRAAKRFRIVPLGFIAAQLRGANEPVQMPAGFVTMVMTDIEGSTALVHRLGERYGTLLERVCTVQRRAVTRAGGREVEARADEFFAAFEVPRAAVDASIEIQRELAAARWDDDAEVRVRIGIHSGYPTSTDRNYIGLDVHLTARICAAAHGGQIVVSANTREAARATVSADVPDVRFRRLGSYRLRGIPDEVVLHQVLGEGLRSRFPPLR